MTTATHSGPAPTPTPTYSVYAVRYARMSERPRQQNFIVCDLHDHSNMPMDYFVWVITNDRRTIVVDTGFDAAEAAGRGRELLRLPREGLAMLGVDAATVQDVVITHMHYDHAGTLDDFPQAGFHRQDLEMAYATGRCMAHKPFGYAYTREHVKTMVDKVFDGKVSEIALTAQDYRAVAPWSAALGAALGEQLDVSPWYELNSFLGSTFR